MQDSSKFFEFTNGGLDKPNFLDLSLYSSADLLIDTVGY
jgi:hypothetical protein